MGSLFHATGALGSLAANLASGALRQSLSPEALHAWGWKVPFYAGVFLLIIGARLRTSLRETGPGANGAKEGVGEGPTSPGQAAEQMRVRARRVGWLIVVSMLFMVFGFWAYVFVPAYLTSVREPPLRSAYTIAAVAQLSYCLSLLVFAYASDRLHLHHGRSRQLFLVGGALLSVVAFPAASYGLQHLDAWGCALALTSVSVVHAIYGGSLPVYVFEHAGPLETRVSTISVLWALGATAFGGTMPSICEALSDAYDGLVAPSCYIALAALASATAVVLGERALDPRSKLIVSRASFEHLVDEDD
mmetsp:Transcript_24083/g.60906  ORF Transcript_24083/g.60906 Transcript_24083/m.60906 type:complete len:304 (+) Transcript_24083:484-1395(+)